jgi:hypothetical protein
MVFLWMSRPQHRSWTTCIDVPHHRGLGGRGDPSSKTFPRVLPAKLGRQSVVPAGRQLRFHLSGSERHDSAALHRQPALPFSCAVVRADSHVRFRRG